MPFDLAEKMWIQKAIQKPGSLKRDLGIGADEKIPGKRLATTITRLTKRGEGKKKLKAKERRTLRRALLAKTLRKFSREDIQRINSWLKEAIKHIDAGE